MADDERAELRASDLDALLDLGKMILGGHRAPADAFNQRLLELVRAGLEAHVPDGELVGSLLACAASLAVMRTQLRLADAGRTLQQAWGMAEKSKAAGGVFE